MSADIEHGMLLGMLADDLTQIHEMTRLGQFGMARSHLDGAREKVTQLESLAQKKASHSAGSVQAGSAQAQSQSPALPGAKKVYDGGLGREVIEI